MVKPIWLGRDTMNNMEDEIAFAMLGVADEDQRCRLVDAVLDMRGVRGTGESMQVLDPNITGGGGAAFLWEDVVALGDAVDAAVDLLGDFSPTDGAKLLWSMVGLWRQLRKVRVELTRDEFRVLRAIKRGNRTVPAIAAYATLAPATVDDVVRRLQSRRYREEIPLVEAGQDGLSTRF